MALKMCQKKYEKPKKPKKGKPQAQAKCANLSRDDVNGADASSRSQIQFRFQFEPHLNCL